jgi:hypothetical protein
MQTVTIDTRAPGAPARIMPAITLLSLPPRCTSRHSPLMTLGR